MTRASCASVGARRCTTASALWLGTTIRSSGRSSGASSAHSSGQTPGACAISRSRTEAPTTLRRWARSGAIGPLGVATVEAELVEDDARRALHPVGDHEPPVQPAAERHPAQELGELGELDVVVGEPALERGVVLQPESPSEPLLLLDDVVVGDIDAEV